MRALDVIIIMFLLTQVLSLGIGAMLIEGQNTNPALAAFNIAPSAPQDITNAFYLIAVMLIGAGALLLILMLPFRDNVILIVEFLSTSVASFVVFFVFLSAFGVREAELISVLCSLLLFVARLYYVPFRNVLAIVASAGVGALIGFSIDPIPLFVFVIFVAIYDFLSVNWTKHMVTFAKHFMKQKTSFSIGFEGTHRKRMEEKGRTVTKEEPWRIELGSGDMAIASTITVVSYKLGGFFFPIVAMAGSAIGLYLLMEKATKEKKVMPAMPMIVGFSLLFLAVSVVLVSLLRF